jgi:hypothetical protein
MNTYEIDATLLASTNSDTLRSTSQSFKAKDNYYTEPENTKPDVRKKLSAPVEDDWEDDIPDDMLPL